MYILSGRQNGNDPTEEKPDAVASGFFGVSKKCCRLQKLFIYTVGTAIGCTVILEQNNIRFRKNCAYFRKIETIKSILLADG